MVLKIQEAFIHYQTTLKNVPLLQLYNESFGRQILALPLITFFLLLSF